MVEEEFEVPVEITRGFRLPVGYDTGEGWSKNVVISDLTGRDEEEISRIGRTSPKMVSVILRACMRTLEGEEIPSDFASKITTYDRIAILIELRRLMYGDEMKLEYRCSSCRDIVSAEIDFADLASDIKYCEVYPAHEEVELKVGLRADDGSYGKKVKIRVPSGEDADATASAMRRNPVEGSSRLLWRCIVSVDGKEKPATAESIRDARSMDRVKLFELLEDDRYGYPGSIETECPVCGGFARVPMDFAQFFRVGRERD